MDPQVYWVAIGGTGLVSLNAWLFRRMIAKIEHLTEIVVGRLPVQENETKHLRHMMEDFKSQLAKLSHELKDVSALRERLAVLEALIKRRRKPVDPS